MEKVKITESVGLRIAELRSGGKSNKGIIDLVLNEGISKYDPLNDVNFDDLVKALYNGYKTKGTPHEEIRKHYNAAIDEPFDEDEFEAGVRNGIKKGIKITLNELNITIKGINN